MKTKGVICILAVAILACAASGQEKAVFMGENASSKMLAQEMSRQTTDTASLQVVFSDGQIIDATGRPADAKAYLEGRMSERDYNEKVVFTPLTRGRVLMPGTCTPQNGEDCGNNLKCACYPTQTCKPGDPKADYRGCFDPVPPKNAHLVEKVYVCNKGFQWDGGSGDCVEIRCKPGEAEFEGECYGQADEVPPAAYCFLMGVGMLPLMAAGAVVLLALAALAYRRLRK